MSKDKWSALQRQRMDILFEYYLEIGQAYRVMQKLRSIFNEKVDHLKGGGMLMRWFKDVDALGRELFNTVVRTCLKIMQAPEKSAAPSKNCKLRYLCHVDIFLQI